MKQIPIFLLVALALNFAFFVFPCSSTAAIVGISDADGYLYVNSALGSGPSIESTNQGAPPLTDYLEQTYDDNGFFAFSSADYAIYPDNISASGYATASNPEDYLGAPPFGSYGIIIGTTSNSFVNQNSIEFSFDFSSNYYGDHGSSSADLTLREVAYPSESIWNWSYTTTGPMYDGGSYSSGLIWLDPEIEYFYTLEFSFYAMAAGDPSGGINEKHFTFSIDNFSADATPVPIPSTLLLLGPVFLSIIGFRRLKTKPTF